MKHVTYAEKSLLIGDEAADTLTEYSAMLANLGRADTVTLKAFGADGDDVEATFVLDQGTILMAESTHSSIPDPDNAEAVRGMRETMMRLSSPAGALPPDETMPSSYEELGLD
jgi:hypothetical protein